MLDDAITPGSSVSAAETGAKFDDGNKESIKEVLSTFRTLFAINVSGIFVVLGLYQRDPALVGAFHLFWCGIACATASAVLMIYMFLVTIPMIFRREHRIIYDRLVLRTSLAALAFFVLGYAMTILSIALR